MDQRADETIVEGEVEAHAGGGRAVAILSIVAEHGHPAMRIEGTELVLVTDDGARVRVLLDGRTAMAPRDAVRGPWRDVRRHPAAPAIELDPGRNVTLRGSWVLAGEPVAVAAIVEREGFVVGTGGPRQAPVYERRLRAIAIAAGPDARARMQLARADAARAGRRLA